MHETRKGEMAATGEVPFALYYGGVDTTPLFVVLAGAYAERTGDLALIDESVAGAGAAAQWIEASATRTLRPAGLSARGETAGLANQGWKDSDDSVFHADGRFPDGPIALVEVQALCIRGIRHDGPFRRAARLHRSGDAIRTSARRNIRQRVEEQLLDGRVRASTASRSTARANCAACWPRMPGICWPSACVARERGEAVARAL